METETVAKDKKRMMGEEMERNPVFWLLIGRQIWYIWEERGRKKDLLFYWTMAKKEPVGFPWPLGGPGFGLWYWIL